MLTITSTNDESTSCAKLLGLTTQKSEGGLICNTVSLLAPTNDDGGFDTCSFLSPASDADIVAFCESSESCGSIAYSGSESCGSIAYSSSESCGSIASSGGSSFSCGGGCSYSC
jgi:hypothetical protein